MREAPIYAGAVRPELPDAHHTWGLAAEGPRRKECFTERRPHSPGCRYPAARRSNPTCRAPGTWAEAWKPRSGSALAETERLSASERPSKVRNRRTGPRGWWPGPKGQRVRSPDGTTGDGDTNSRRTKGRSRPGRISPSGNRVSPTRPVARRKPDRKEGRWRRG